MFGSNRNPKEIGTQQQAASVNSAGKGNNNPRSAGSDDAVSYLLQYGYFPQISMRGVNASAPLISESSIEFSNAIKGFQEFAGLKQTGKLDSETRELMASPRCGVADKGKLELRHKRYVTHSSKWDKNHLTYYVGVYPDDSLLRRNDVDREIEAAFDIWDRASVLSFRRVFSPDEADISLEFHRGQHGTDQPFDGRGGVLAHAFFPRWGGDVHFDAAENWVNDRLRSTSSPQKNRPVKQLLQTAVHEIGHSLGLEHSRNRRAIMAPFYQGWMEEVKLREDDILGIESIYGKQSVPDDAAVFGPTIRPLNPQGSTTTTAKPTTVFKPVLPVNDNKHLCHNPDFDAVTQTNDGSFYVFRGGKYWKLKLNQAGFESGYPRPNSDWSGLPGKLDAAAYNPKDGMTYLFKDNQVGKYLNMKIQPGYPKAISEEFPGAPSGGLDAALLWGGNRQLYFFKGSEYWKFNLEKRKVEDFYPKKISKRWGGIPDNLSSAIRWKNNKSYFFKDGEYYRFDDKTFAVEANPRVRYPRTVGKWWLGCNFRPQIAKDAIAAEEEGDLAVPGSVRNPRRWIWGN